MFKKLVKKIVDFYYPVVPDDRLDAVKMKCDEVMNAHDIGDPKFEKALALRMQVDNFEAELEKNKPAKPKKEFKLDPAIIVAGIGATAQLVCTFMVETFQSEGGIFKSGTTGWINGNGLFSKFFTPKTKNE